MNPLETRALYDLSHTLAAPLLEKVRYPWEALSGIGAFIAALGPTLSQEEYASPRPGVWIHKTAVLAPTAFVGDTVIIGPGAEVRHGAFIRGNALVGEGAVVGNSTELKNVILFDRVQVPHYNYVGRHAGRFGGNRLRKRAEPRHCGGPGGLRLSPVHGAGLYTRPQHL